MEQKKEGAAGAVGSAGMGAGWLMGFVAGAAIGIGAGLLFAPKTGRETREILRTKAMQVKEAATGAAEKVKQGAAQAGQVAQQTAKGVQEEIKGSMQSEAGKRY